MTDPHGPLWADVCLHPVRLTDAEIEFMDTYERDVNPPDMVGDDPLPVILRCGQPVDHDGLHRASTAASLYETDLPAPVLWFEWDRDVRRWTTAPWCPAISDDYDGRLCMRETGHDGPHGFMFAPAHSWPFPEETVRGREHEMLERHRLGERFGGGTRS